MEYPLEKEDLATIPDFWPEAMENLGLVTFMLVFKTLFSFWIIRQISLMIFQGRSSALSRESIF